MNERPHYPVSIKRNRVTAARVREVLNLPDDRWSGVQVEFGSDEQAIANVQLILTGEQLVALAQIAATSYVPADADDHV